MAKFKSKTQQTYEAVLDDPTATPADKLKAAELLEKYKTQRTHYRRHTKAKALLGLGAKERVGDALPPGAIRCTDRSMRIIHLSEGTQVFPPATPEELAIAKPIKEKLDADRRRDDELRKNETYLETLKRWASENLGVRA